MTEEITFKFIRSTVNRGREYSNDGIHWFRDYETLTESTNAPNVSKKHLSDERIMEVARRHWKMPGNDVIAFVRELLG